MLPQQCACSLFLVRQLGVIDGYGVASEHLDYFHARDICLAVTHIYHMWERDSLVFFKLALVHELVVPDAEYSLVDFEEELCLCGVVDRHARPFCFSILVVEE